MLTNFCNNWGKWWSYLPPLQQYCHVWPEDDARGHHRLNFPPSVATEVKWQTDANMQQWPLRDNKDQSSDKNPIAQGETTVHSSKPYITATFAHYRSAVVLELHYRPLAKCCYSLIHGKVKLIRSQWFVAVTGVVPFPLNKWQFSGREGNVLQAWLSPCTAPVSQLVLLAGVPVDVYIEPHQGMS